MRDIFRTLKKQGIYNPSCKHLYPRGRKLKGGMAGIPLAPWPTLTLTPTPEGADAWNEIVLTLRENGFEKDLPLANANQSWIDFKPAQALMHDSYETTAIQDANGGCHRFVLLAKSRYGNFRVIMTSSVDKDGKSPTKMSGHEAFNRLKDAFAEDGIDIMSYETDEGWEIKSKIPSYLLDVIPFAMSDRNGLNEYGEENSFENVHHIDTHSAFAGALADVHPELRKTLERMYEERHEHPENKSVLTNSIGYMQCATCTSSNGSRYALANLAYDAISTTNDKLLELAERLDESGRVVLAYNVDGIWYMGDIYHGEGEGDGMGQWHNDHLNCKIRFKGPKCYEYIEDGVYHVSASGRRRYEDTLPRDKWQWGDLFREEAQQVVNYRLNGDGLLEEAVREEE